MNMDFLLEFIGDASPWLLLLLIPLYFWGKLNYSALQNRESYPDSYQRAVNWLREDNVGQLYVQFLGWLMDGVSRLIGDRHKFGQAYATSVNHRGLIHKTFGFNPFTPESYERLLRLAFIYPVMFFLAAWFIGGAGRVAGADWLNLSQGEGMRTWVLSSLMIIIFLGWSAYAWNGWKRWFSLGFSLLLAFFILEINDANVQVGLFFFAIHFVFVFFVLYVGGVLFGGIYYLSVVKAHGDFYVVAFLYASLTAISIVTPGNAIFVFSGVVAIALLGGRVIVLNLGFYFFTVAFSYYLLVSNFSSMRAVAIDDLRVSLAILFSSVIFLLLLDFVKRQFLTANSEGWFLFFYTTLFFLLSYFCLYYFSWSGGWQSVWQRHAHLEILLLWFIFPLVNAPLDWLSLGVTRGLLQAMRLGHHKGVGALGFAAVDLLLALVFLFLITAVLVGVTALGNAIAETTLVDIHGILSGIKGNPASVDHWWIYFMLLSTLVPTLIHFALAGGAATLWLPRKWRLQIADGLERDVHKTFAAWAYLTFTPVIGFIVVPGLLLYCLWWLVTTHDAWLGMHLLNWAQMLADFANPQVTTP